MRANQSLAKWRAGQQTIGGWLSLANTHIAEMMSRAGFDWLCIDLQHGLVDYQDLLHMLPAISATETTPLVRVTGNDASEIMKVLDAGAMGVIVPLVNNRSEAQEAVSACKYPPMGLRSFGPTRAALYAGPGYADGADSEIACIVMIETRQGLDNLEEIVTTPGLGGVFIGPADLALALDLPPVGDTDDPEHLAAVERILKACKQHDVPAGIYAGSPEFVKKRLDMGFDFVNLGNDSGSLMRAVSQDLRSIRGESG